MLIKLPVIVAVFAFALPVLCIQGCAQSHKAKQGKDGKQPSPAAPATLPQNQASGASEAIRENDTETKVRIVSAPEKDVFDKAAVYINALLAFVGLAGILIALFTLHKIKIQADEMRLQRLATETTMQAINRQADVMEKTIVLQYRPKLVVRVDNIETNNVSAIAEPPTGRLWFGVINVGGTPATVIDARLTVEIHDRVPIPRFHPGLTQFDVGTLVAGAAKNLVFELPGHVNDAIRKATERWTGVPWSDGSKVILFVGLIKHRDEIGVERTTRIWRTYDPNRGTFVPSRDADREYSD